jgi:hypothetical protein
MKFQRYAVAGALLMAAALQPWAARPSAQAAAWFRANFNNLNEAGANMYNFANRYAQSSTTWATDHQATGGWNGTGGAHVRVFGCPNGNCGSEIHQMNVGWQTPAIGQPLGRPFQLGDSAFVRFRIKFDANTVFPAEGFGAKFILWGSTGTAPNSRWIIHLWPPYENGGCSLGFESYSYLGWTPPSTIWHQASHWGLPAFPRNATNRFGGFSSNVNIGWSCNPAVLVHASNYSPAVKPQNNGAAPSNGWYHLQFQATSGGNGQADFRSWANNNNQSAPSAQHLDMADGLGVQGWDQGVFVVGYWGTSYNGEIGFTIDDFEIGASFDPAWYPGGGGGTPAPQPPGAPNGVRIISN